MKKNAYTDLPNHCFWKRSVTDVKFRLFDPVVDVPFKISKTDKVATAGSCFAQHIARYLRDKGFNYLITEPAHEITLEEDISAFNYGTFTARYGNLYTVRQLVQLFKRAYGQFVPQETVWQEAENKFIDPFRPQIQPNGFATLEEFYADRHQHFAAVRQMFETLDIFVFTLGLTEAWTAVADNAVFPLCPGVAGGVFDAEKYRLHNFTTAEITEDMLAFIGLLRGVNPQAKIILTVSPVPLMATACADRHVLTATTYSKSVLRVVCEEITRQCEQTVYFPSYEIITGNYSRGRYFASDLRSVNEMGVHHVMRLFLKHFTGTVLPINSTAVPANKANKIESPAPKKPKSSLAEMERLVAVNCDEEAIK